MDCKHVFSPQGGKAEVEEGLDFSPKFDANGLIPALAMDASTREPLIVFLPQGDRNPGRRGHGQTRMDRSRKVVQSRDGLWQTVNSECLHAGDGPHGRKLRDPPTGSGGGRVPEPAWWIVLSFTGPAK